MVAQLLPPYLPWRIEVDRGFLIVSIGAGVDRRDTRVSIWHYIGHEAGAEYAAAWDAVMELWAAYGEHWLEAGVYGNELPCLPTF